MNYKGIRYLLAALLFGACADSTDTFDSNEPVIVRFSVAEVEADVTTRASSHTLEGGVTVRILAFRRTGINPNLSTDELAGQATYTATGDGKLTSVAPLSLRVGTYDFYAITPHLEVDGTTVSVGHGVDYAASLTEAKTISEVESEVELTPLKRRCTQLTFALSPKNENITSVDIKSVELTNQTQAPQIVPLSESFQLAGVAQNAAVALAGDGFSCPDPGKTPNARSGSTIVLPRNAGAFELKMTVSFNGMADTEIKADLPADLIFAEGTHYTFTLKMKGSVAQLTLTVTPWGNEPLSPDIGGYEKPSIEILVGEWTDINFGAATGEGNATVTVGGWQPDQNWNDVAGSYSGLISGVFPWTTEEDVSSGTGDGSGSATSPGDWDESDNRVDFT